MPFFRNGVAPEIGDLVEIRNNYGHFQARLLTMPTFEGLITVVPTERTEGIRVGASRRQYAADVTRVVMRGLPLPQPSYESPADIRMLDDTNSLLSAAGRARPQAHRPRR